MRWWTFFVALAFSTLQNSPEGRGSITGIVERSGAGSPIADVIVRLKPILISAADGAARHESSFTTDDSGKFEFKNLLPGRYRVYWVREGYFPPALGPGTFEGNVHISTGNGAWARLNVDQPSPVRNPSDRNIIVDISQGQVRDLRLPLIPGSVITGRVLDARGRPLAGGRLSALRVTYESGTPILNEDDSVTTNDRGDYRFYGLQPGRYYIRYDNRQTSGRDGIRYSYFPGVSLAASASAVSVTAGGESTGINFSGQSPATVKISGTITLSIPGYKPREIPISPRDANLAVTRPRTYPPNLQFFLIPTDEQSPIDPLAVRLYSSINATADSLVQNFELPGVQAGEYDLYALLYNEDDQSDIGFYAARTRVHVGTDDVRNVGITIGKRVDVEGRVVMPEGTSASGLKAYSTLTAKAALYPNDVDSVETVNPDGTFKLSGVDGQHYAVTLSELPSNFAVIDVRQAGKSVYDEGIVAGDKLSPIEIVVSGNAGSIEVRVFDARRQPVVGAVVALVSSNNHLQTSAFYRRAEFDEDKSRYRPIEGIPPGEYMLYAWDDIPDGAEQNAGFLHEFEGLGVRVVVGPGEHLNTEVPLIMTSN